MPADRLNDSESRASARYGPSAATRAPPARKPAIWLSWVVWLPITEPSGYLSPGSTSGSSAARADENGVPSSTVPKNSSVHNPANGSPGSAIRATSPARMRSRVIISCWRGNRSASPDRSRAADHRRQVGQGVRRRGQERRSGPGVHHEGDGDLRELIARAGQGLGGPQRAELADGEHIAVGHRVVAGLPMPAWPRCVRRPPGKRGVLSVVHGWLFSAVRASCFRRRGRRQSGSHPSLTLCHRVRAYGPRFGDRQ